MTLNNFKLYSISCLFLICGILTGAENEQTSNNSRNLGKIGDYPFPTNPMNDRGKGYLISGKLKNAITNYGDFINWGEKPAGLWGDYAYLPNVTFMAGVPGHAYSSDFNWSIEETIEEGGDVVRRTWSSKSVYNSWFENGDTNFVGILFEAADGRGIWEPDSVSKKSSVDGITDYHQWGINSDSGFVFISVPGEISPNKSTSRIGLIYPWALRPTLKFRADEYDVYEYGDDKEEWTQDDNYMYYGATVSESWFTRWDPSSNTDWHASTMSRVNTHNTEETAGSIFGDTPFTDSGDSYPLLAHSNYSSTWPVKLNLETNEFEPYWPGWWAENYYGDSPQEIWDQEGIVGCSRDRKDPDCWKEDPGRFIADTDVYMEFDDRWAHRGNTINTNDEYEQAGYPLGVKVMAEAHSYGVNYAEDVMFVTVRVRNESGDWCAFERDTDGNKVPITDEYGVQLCGEGLYMPDGTKINHGTGFNYQGVSLGFYMDADAAMGDINGYNGSIHTNADDMMEYIDCKTSDEHFPDGCPEVAGQELRISMAVIYDYDGISGIARDLGIVGTQLLDSPLATDNVDLDQDGITDIYPGEKLKMTDWHWFDWYNRPGVITRESGGNCCAGDPGRPQAKNKEEILLKVMRGDTVNLSNNEKNWFFHSKNPDIDQEDPDFNPHFDSLEGIEETDFWFEGEDGLDCVLVMSCGPLDLEVGEEVPFSFCIIFGQNNDDLIRNAVFAQIMYNNHYQGYTPPSRPNIKAVSDQGKVTIYWDDSAEISRDIVTGYSDFEGYKIYKSRDKGKTWGSPDKRIYDDTDILAGWQPLNQYDLTAEEDSVYCVFGVDENGECEVRGNCPEPCIRGRSIQGPDPLTPWFSLGNDTGFDDIRLVEPVVIDGIEYTYSYVDTNVIDGLEYTYSVVGYDMGVEPPYVVDWVSDGNGSFIPDTVLSNANPDNWSEPTGYQLIENSKGTTNLDPNFVTVYPGPPPTIDLSSVQVVPNPYIVHSMFPETEYLKLIRFTNLPSKCTITIFTISGEKVTQIEHENEDEGYITWDLRTVNNQEISPGLYLYVVESGKQKHIGKFAVVR
tara:strand:+ start:2128 stop:5337 length:3210 start_codon:yes stop_codon:yes gene_type:complete